MLDGLTTWLLLPLGMALGWALSRRAPELDPMGEATPPPENAELVTDNPELQLSLGTVFRRRGEVDQALALHKALSERTDIAPDQRDAAYLELAEDYQQAGLMDQAEAIWRSLAAGHGPQASAAVQELLTVAEQGQDWEGAVQLARQLEALQGASCRPRIAHYRCEMAEQALTDSQFEQAAQLARKALRDDSRAVRPRWLLGRIAEAAGDLRAAAEGYRTALEVDGRYVVDLLPSLETVLEQIGDPRLRDEMLADIAKSCDAPALVVTLAQRAERQGEDPLPMLAEGLKTHPSRTVLKAFLGTMGPREAVQAAGLSDAALALKGALEAMERGAPGFVCEQCGFTPRNRFWQCPACRQWGSIQRVSDRFEA